MYRTSTYFIKAQIPGISVAEILQLYKQELEDQSVSNIQIEGTSLKFSNKTFKFVVNVHANRFSGFTSGQINIDDDGSEYLVTFEADNSRTITIAGIIAVAVTLFSLIFSNFDLSSLLVGFVIFCLLSGIGYGVSTISFPVYFTGIRNNIERKVQSAQTKNY